jgi:hypothetical protein
MVTSINLSQLDIQPVSTPPAVRTTLSVITTQVEDMEELPGHRMQFMEEEEGDKG